LTSSLGFTTPRVLAQEVLLADRAVEEGAQPRALGPNGAGRERTPESGDCPEPQGNPLAARLVSDLVDLHLRVRGDEGQQPLVVLRGPRASVEVLLHGGDVL
jgi:hypothetical protein